MGIEKIWDGLKDFIRNKSANLMIIFAMMAPVVVGAAGMSVDLSRAYLVRERLAHALDASALAAAQLAAADEALAFEKLQKFIEANFPPQKYGEIYNITMDVTEEEVTVTAEAKFETSFLYFAGVQIIDVTAETVVKREVRGLEVALVLDVTGSMKGSKITSLRTATEDFINIIFDRVSDTRYLKVGLVPYAISVNIGDEWEGYVDRPEHEGSLVSYDPDVGDKWAGCVMARDYPHDTLDTTPTYYGDNWQAYWWAHNDDNKWDSAFGGSVYLDYPNADGSGCNGRRSPNLGCPVKNPITPLTSDQTTLLNAADKITHWCRGGTNGNLGMAWGWRVLSPGAPFTEAAAFDSKYWRKAIVMMTDGENTFYKNDYSSYGFVSEGNIETTEGQEPVAELGYDPTPGQSITNKGNATKEINNRFLKICRDMKELGVTVYTVTFGSGIIGKPTEKYYKKCASDPEKYYPAATNDDLIEAFQDISRELSNLHIKG